MFDDVPIVGRERDRASRDPQPMPSSPASQARLRAMCRAILLSIYGPSSEPSWEKELVMAARKLPWADQMRLQGELDQMADELNQGADQGDDRP